MTGVFSVFDHLLDVGIIHDIVIVGWVEYNLFACYLFGLDFSDTLSKSFDFILKILFSPAIKLIRHLNENTGGEWVASGRSHILDEKYIYSYKLRCYFSKELIDQS